MPQMDGTGPMGQGPRGLCNRRSGAQAPDASAPWGQRGCRRGRRGFGRGRGANTGAPFAPASRQNTPAQES